MLNHEKLIEELNKFSDTYNNNASYKLIVDAINDVKPKEDLIAECIKYVCEKIESDMEEIIKSNLNMTRVDDKVIQYQNYHSTGNILESDIWKSK